MVLIALVTYKLEHHLICLLAICFLSKYLVLCFSDYSIELLSF